MLISNVIGISTLPVLISAKTRNWCKEQNRLSEHPPQGQSQTITWEAPTITITNAPANEKSPKLDDGGTGFPPRDDDGGGGGGGGYWSGGFFFVFLAFLGFLKDKESEEQYRDSRKKMRY